MELNIKKLNERSSFYHHGADKFNMQITHLSYKINGNLILRLSYVPLFLLCKLIADGVNVDICTENYTTLKDDDDERHEYNSLITSLLLNHTKSLECPYEVKKNRQKLIFSLNLTSRVVSRSLSHKLPTNFILPILPIQVKDLENKKKTPVKWRENIFNL